MNESHAWVMKRTTKRGTTYHIRWKDPLTGKWKSQQAEGTDGRLATLKQARQQAAKREKELREGTHRNIRRASWADFTDEHCKHITGEANRAEAKRTLKEFGDICNVTEPRRVTFGDIEAYVDYLRTEQIDSEGHLSKSSNSPATVAKKIRYLKAAFNLAIRRGYAAKNPTSGWTQPKPKRKTHRILGIDEEAKLLKSGKKLYGFKMETFIRFLLETWGRLSEATGLQWPEIDLNGLSVTFLDTKSHEDRHVELWPDSNLRNALRRLKAQTLLEGGPFAAYRDKPNLHKKWHRILEDAEIPHITIHDLRRTGITRALLGGMAPIAVQRLAGHANIATTMRYYVQVERDDLRAAVAKYREAASA